jgi:N4-gp56 family major capsid protein
MATTVFGVNDAETNKVWSKKLQVEALKKTWVSKFIGSTDNALIFEQKDLKKAKGDKITYTLRTQIRGKGVQGDNILKGSEEKLTHYSDALYIDQLRHAVDRGGNMSIQRVLMDLRKGCNDALSDWWAARFDRWFFCVGAGYNATDEVDEFGEIYQGNDTRYTGNNAVTAPTSGRHFWSEAGADKDEDLDSTGDTMTLTLIDDLVAQAKLASPMIRPLKIDGEDRYVLFLHTKQVRDLRKDASTAGNWVDIQKAAMQGGQVSNNPIFTGALGMYNGVILHESPRVVRGVNSSTLASISTVRRAMFCGAQALTLGFGMGHGFESWVWAEEDEDYGNQLGVAAGCIAGMKKSVFNSNDFGVLVLSTYAA